MFCENPVILLNPKLRKLTVHCDYMHSPLGDYSLLDKRLFDFRRVRPKICDKLTKDNYNEYFVANSSTGETFPLYILVPCGKCPLCRLTKKNELAFRCVAETNRFDTLPLFITLTYNNAALPDCGVCKADVQRFLKRLRARLDYEKIEHNLRYLCVSEYGKSFGRPHYHMLLWNFPVSAFPNISAVVHFIERAWSVYLLSVPCSKRVSLSRAGELFRFTSGRRQFDAVSLGFVYVLPLKEGGVDYVLKYMMKDKDAVPCGKNPLFMLSSRKNGGIGSEYIRSQRDYFLSAKNITTLSIVDKLVSGRVVKTKITPYIKSLLMPSPSRKYRRKEYNLMKEFCQKLSKFMNLCVKFNELYKPIGYSRETMDEYYEPFTDIYSRPIWTETLRKCRFLGYVPEREVDDDYSWIKDKDTWNQFAYECLDELENLCIKILDIPDYNAYFDAREQYLNERGLQLEYEYCNMTPADPHVLADKIRYSMARALTKEKI
ncbi:replication initiation protein [Lepus americanus faeces associated microvirus SHP1 6472]|uniref:replication initiation protein n=1 Tax=Lepus americanus faeces associated microvirus SHP1 6472 TaxID=2219217 RepID=UPI000DF0371E|nr:replication initiation protein [Lepus americanus faeces associated microvirus SHP1 6472]AXB22592.1 replication initiation protein [Lepus americanus faeces associated microvirus SHP1 6472]